MISLRDVDDILGAPADRLVALAGWITPSPSGHDYAQLLLHPLGDGVSAEMATVAELLGLARCDAGTMPKVSPDTTWATLADHPSDGPSIWLHLGQDVWVHRPISSQWAACVIAQRELILWVSLDAGPADTIADMDRIVTPARAHRLWAGRIRATTSSRA